MDTPNRGVASSHLDASRGPLVFVRPPPPLPAGVELDAPEQQQYEQYDYYEPCHASDVHRFLLRPILIFDVTG